MSEQNASGHSRYVPGFHFISFGIIVAALVVAVLMVVNNGMSLPGLFAVLAAAGMLLLFFYTRLFATQNQDRIIRAEENFRHYRLTGKPLDERLTRAQVIALRFAGDDELATLAGRAVQENMTPAAIKQAIKQWRADHHRV